MEKPIKYLIFICLLSWMAFCIGCQNPPPPPSNSKKAKTQPPPRQKKTPSALVVFLVDKKGRPQIVDTLRLQHEHRVEESTGEKGTPEYLTYRFTPHEKEPVGHWSASF